VGNGYILLAEHSWGAGRARGRISDLESAGIVLRIPGNGRITMLDPDPEALGAQVELDEKEALTLLVTPDGSAHTSVLAG
jgi:hypothetical protein